MLAALLVTSQVGAQQAAASTPSVVYVAGRPRDPAEVARLRVELQEIYDDRPVVALPIAVAATGVVVGIGSLYIGALSLMGDCAGPCNNEYPKGFLIAAAIGGGVGLIGGIWTFERVSARRANNRRYREVYQRLYGSGPALRLAIGPSPSLSATLRF